MSGSMRELVLCSGNIVLRTQAPFEPQNRLAIQYTRVRQKTRFPIFYLEYKQVTVRHGFDTGTHAVCFST
jgi:hypothetical protein